MTSGASPPLVTSSGATAAVLSPTGLKWHNKSKHTLHERGTDFMFRVVGGCPFAKHHTIVTTPSAPDTETVPSHLRVAVPD